MGCFYTSFLKLDGKYVIYGLFLYKFVETRMKWNGHKGMERKGMERNGMYLSKGNEWN